MANLKNITDVPVVESAAGLNLIANDNGVAKQIAANMIGRQADWTETDETSPAFVKNKPVEEWDLDLNIIVSYNPDADMMIPEHTINHMVDFVLIKEKIVNGIKPKMKISYEEQTDSAIDAPYVTGIPFIPLIGIAPIGFTPWNENQEGVIFELGGFNNSLVFILLKDGSTNVVIP